jgi:hypothetical protein
VNKKITVDLGKRKARDLTRAEWRLALVMLSVTDLDGLAALLGVHESSVLSLFRRTATRRTVLRARRVLCNVGPCWTGGDA